jgi:2-C-methyl-D-erythritol 4-phosphate cytidylyltransferase/2-C-methyl-D-erythritol 2,4-cyclodiphosphate synthase
MKYLIGFGYDCHKIIKNRPLFLGGVKINVPFGLKGHSDADVVLHSICDAILSACGAPDIGELFPDNLEETKNMSSKVIVEKVLKLLKEKKGKIINIDVTLICDKPKISEYKTQILSSLKNLFKTKNINIKGKTTEEIKSFKNYIQCFSIVFLNVK